MALHSRDVVTVSAAVATRSRAHCSSMETRTSLSTAIVYGDIAYPFVAPLMDVVSWRKWATIPEARPLLISVSRPGLRCRAPFIANA